MVKCRVINQLGNGSSINSTDTLTEAGLPGCPRFSGTSQRSVEVHRARVREKMHARLLTHLVRMLLVAEGSPHK
jgi:hypothetical protein